MHATEKKLKFSMIDFRDIPIDLFWSPVNKPDESEFFLVYNCNIPSIWPFMCHPCFPTKNSQKQHFSSFSSFIWWLFFSWERKNATFETFLVGKQGWRIKGQMLRKLMLYLFHILFQIYQACPFYFKTDEWEFLRSKS